MIASARERQVDWAGLTVAVGDDCLAGWTADVVLGVGELVPGRVTRRVEAIATDVLERLSFFRGTGARDWRERA